MEFVLLLLIIVILFVLLNLKGSFAERIAGLESRILDLQRLIEKQGERPAAKEPGRAKDPLPAPPLVIRETVPPPVLSQPPKPVVKAPPKREPVLTPAQPAWKEPELSFFERHPDLEKFIGENLVNKIAIAILVLAIGFFVKYAIDVNWIGEVGRVGIGVLCGGILIGIAHWLRNSYKAFSSVLVGGGIAILYITISLAYHQFHLFDQKVSFIILIVITGFAVALSLLYDKQELAVIALIGGLASPFMVSSDKANYHALFIYLITLNTGLLCIAYFKQWRILNISAFSLTLIICSGVLYVLPNGMHAVVLGYLSVLYLLFFAINIANNVKENKQFIGTDFTILLVNTGLYFGAGLYLLTAMDAQHLRGAFSAGLALINLLLSFLLFKNRKVDTNVLYLLIGITLTFISLTAPIQLNGHYITLFWAAEAVVLYWLFQKSGIKLMKLSSMLVWMAMVVSLLMDWQKLYTGSTILIIIANKGFITSLVAAVSSFLLQLLVKDTVDEQDSEKKLQSGIYKYATLIILFLGGMLELNHQFETRYPATDLNMLYLSLYVPAFIYLFSLLPKKLLGIQNDWRSMVSLMACSILFYLAVIQNGFDIQQQMLDKHRVSGLHFMAHWLAAITVALLFYRLTGMVRSNLSAAALKIASWILAIAIVLFISLEMNLATYSLFHDSISLERLRTLYIKTVLPIVWGISSFAMMWIGMKRKSSTLRIISLTLFSVTLLKLFLFDIRNIPPAGKIAAFFCLGVLLLTVSFMYQKVKKVLVEDEKTE